MREKQDANKDLHLPSSRFRETVADLPVVAAEVCVIVEKPVVAAVDVVTAAAVGV